MNKMKAKASNQNKFLRIITTPIRVLCKARDLYVKSMINYADRMNYGHVAVPGASQVRGLPRTFSATSSRSYQNEDFRELVRASSARSLGARVSVDSNVRQQMTGSTGGPQAMPPRSSSVAMGRIDEDAPCCYFGEENINGDSFGVNKNGFGKYPRSKSHVVMRKTVF